MTGVIPAAELPSITTQLTGVGTPSSGIELLSLLPSNTDTALCTVASDLAGNVIWYYNLPPGAFPDPINDVRESDLAGNDGSRGQQQQVPIS